MVESTHEERGVSIIRRLVPAHSADEVVAFVEGKHSLPLIVSGASGVDLDRADYLMRDSMHLGVPPPFAPEDVAGALSLGPDGALRVDRRFALGLRRHRAFMREHYYTAGAVADAERRVVGAMQGLIAARGGAGFTEAEVLSAANVLPASGDRAARWKGLDVIPHQHAAQQEHQHALTSLAPLVATAN